MEHSMDDDESMAGMDYDFNSTTKREEEQKPNSLSRHHLPFGSSQALPLFAANQNQATSPPSYRPAALSLPSHMEALTVNARGHFNSLSSDTSPVSSTSSSSKRQKRRLSAIIAEHSWPADKAEDVESVKKLEKRLQDAEEKHSQNLNHTIKHYENEIWMLQEYIQKLKKMFNYQAESNYCISPRSMELYHEEIRKRTVAENKMVASKLEDEEQRSRVMDLINKNKQEEEERTNRRKLALQLVEQEKNRRLMTPEDEVIQAYRRKSSLKLANQVVELTSSRKFASNHNGSTTSSKVGRWKKEESDKFAEGLVKFGRDWDALANYIGTRNGVQVRSHAQKYFRKLAKDRAREAAHLAQEAGLSGDALINAVSAAAYSVDMSTAQRPRKDGSLSFSMDSSVDHKVHLATDEFITRDLFFPISGDGSTAVHLAVAGDHRIGAGGDDIPDWMLDIDFEEPHDFSV